MKCFECKKDFQENAIKAEPNRHACSPNSFNWNAKNEQEKRYLYFCNQECKNVYQKKNYAEWAEFDRNASDSECFQHETWDGDFRIGTCKVTGMKVRVEPLMPGDRSGQPKECYDHFTLRETYKKLVT